VTGGALHQRPMVRLNETTTFEGVIPEQDASTHRPECGASGRACRYMCTPEANLGKPPQESSVIHLREARAEWERRHAKPVEKK
jgi:hypothetical protein